MNFVNFLFLLLTTLHFGKDLNFLHSAKCSVSKQLTYIQKIQYNKVSISTIKSSTRAIFKITKNTFLHLKLNTLPILKYFVIFGFLDFFGYLATLVFYHVWYQFANFDKTKIGL